MLITNKYILRLSTFLLVILIIQPPFNTWEKIILLSLSSSIIFFSEIKKYTIKNDIIFILSFIIIFISQNLFSKNYLISNHIVLPSYVSNNYDYIKDNFPEELEKKLKFELEKLLSVDNSLKDIPQPGSNNFSTLNNKYAFQAENIWTDVNEGKHIMIKKKIDFWDLGPSALNEINLNIVNYNKTSYKNNVVFPVLFKINFSKNYDKSSLCFSGNLYYESNNNFIFYDDKKNKCIIINDKTDYYLLDHKRDLELYIKANFFYDNNYLFFYTLTIILLLIIVITIYKIKYLYLITSISFFIVLFIYLKFSPNAISGFSETFYFARLNDGLIHYGYARIMANHFVLGNFYEGLKGAADVFYFMPLTRYINTLLFILFGDNILGSIFIISFFPILIFKILNLFFDDKTSKYLVIIFIFFPIFESLGFTMINYINFTVDGYGEGICYFFLMLILFLYFKNEEYKSKFFLIGFLSFIVIGIRPNYIAFIYPLIIGYIIYLIFNRHIIVETYKKIFFLISGTSLIILIPIHNYVYSNEIVLLVKNTSLANNLQINLHDYFEFFINFFSINQNDINYNKVIKHISHYIKIYEVWFMIVLLNLFIVFLFKIHAKFKILSISLIIMHSTFLFFKGDPRYSMGTWLLSFIVFIYMFKEIYFPLIKKNFLIKKFN